MRELLSVVTRKGQITLPAEIRKSLHIREGDKVAFSLEGTDTPQVIIRPVRSVAEMTFGSVTPRKRPEDFQELRRLFVEGMAEDLLSEAPAAEKKGA